MLDQTFVHKLILLPAAASIISANKNQELRSSQKVNFSACECDGEIEESNFKMKKELANDK